MNLKSSGPSNFLACMKKVSSAPSELMVVELLTKEIGVGGRYQKGIALC